MLEEVKKLRNLIDHSEMVFTRYEEGREIISELENDLPPERPFTMAQMDGMRTRRRLLVLKDEELEKFL